MLNQIDENPEIVFIKQLFEDKKYEYDEFKEAMRRIEKTGNAVISRSYKQIKAKIEARVVAGAMKGTFNAPFTQFMLKNNYGWKDKHEVKQEIKGDIAFTQILDDIEGVDIKGIKQLGEGDEDE